MVSHGGIDRPLAPEPQGGLLPGVQLEAEISGNRRIPAHQISSADQELGSLRIGNTAEPLQRRVVHSHMLVQNPAIAGAGITKIGKAHRLGTQRRRRGEFRPGGNVFAHLHLVLIVRSRLETSEKELMFQAGFVLLENPLAAFAA